MQHHQLFAKQTSSGWVVTYLDSDGIARSISNQDLDDLPLWTLEHMSLAYNYPAMFKWEQFYGNRLYYLLHGSFTRSKHFSRANYFVNVDTIFDSIKKDTEQCLYSLHDFRQESTTLVDNGMFHNPGENNFTTITRQEINAERNLSRMDRSREIIVAYEQQIREKLQNMIQLTQGDISKLFVSGKDKALTVNCHNVPFPIMFEVAGGGLQPFGQHPSLFHRYAANSLKTFFRHPYVADSFLPLLFKPYLAVDVITPQMRKITVVDVFSEASPDVNETASSSQLQKRARPFATEDEPSSKRQDRNDDMEFGKIKRIAKPKTQIVKVTFETAKNGKHKMVAKFYNRSNTLVKKVGFGQHGAKDYIKHSPADREERKKAYIQRHNNRRENWNKCDTAGALSRFILWNKPTLQTSITDFKKRFKLL